MEPIHFDNETRDLTAPMGMTDEECGPLPVYTDGKSTTSCWKMTWKERLSALRFGRIWLQVHYGKSQPPVNLYATRQLIRHWDENGVADDQTRFEKAVSAVVSGLNKLHAGWGTALLEWSKL